MYLILLKNLSYYIYPLRTLLDRSLVRFFFFGLTSSTNPIPSQPHNYRPYSLKRDLLKEVEKLQAEELTKIKFTPARVTELDGFLYNAYVIQCPKPIDYHSRRDLIRIFNVIAKEIYGNNDSSPVVEGYGSFVMDMFNQKSDLDMSVNFNHSIEVPRMKMIETLRKFSKKLFKLQRSGHVTGVQTILSAKVPIIKVTDRGTGIECDLSVDNRDGIAKSHIIHAVTAIDERFRMLSFLMKSWAQEHNINSSKDRTLNSLSIVSLVAFHLQTCNPPILPPFAALLKEGADIAYVTNVVQTFSNYGKKNQDSLAKLFITLFVKLALVENYWQKGFCASLYEGSWILKSWGRRSYSISIEDFTDRSENVARAVGTEEQKMIYTCIHNSLNQIKAFLNGQMPGIKLMGLLFGKHTVSTLGIGSTSNMHNLPIMQNPPPLPPPKRRRLGERFEESQAQQPSERNNFVQGLQGTGPQGVGGGVQRETLFKSLASFVPSYKPPTSIPSANHSYSPRMVPSPYAINPVAFGGSYNPSIQSHFVPSQSSLSSIGTSHQQAVAPTHQQAVAPNIFIGDQVHSQLAHVNRNQYRRDHTFYNHRNH
ncbi:putative polynucleotide adenylyltransferase [Lupinus albus]|uniref:Putative polynucleotide adenylyltransferase n=1 Tax=Lupinus albus TaxID=3870 RepID=A0A6A4PSF5_LUPAL|nr:putative polynucleotide adenylyltransferase [Lupinus albus]